MKQNLLLIALFVCGMIACNEAVEAPTTTTISGTITNPGDAEKVEIQYTPMIGDRSTIAEAEIAEDGTFSMTVPTEEPIPVRIRVGSETSSMFLHPGDALKVSLDVEKFDESIMYEGEGAVVNNYLAARYLVEEEYENGLEESNVYKLELEEFLKAHNGLHETLMAHYDETIGDQEVPQEFKDFAKMELVANWANTLENYPNAHAYYTKQPDFEVDESYYAFREKIDINDASGLQSPAFRSYVGGYTGRTLNEMVEADEELKNDWPTAYRAVYEKIAKDESLNGEVKEFIQASQLHDYISFFGTDGADTMMEDFKSLNAESPYIAEIDETYAKWAKIGKGQDAPDFTYTSIEGEEVSFSDFLGKVVYMDVWATWCGPCKAEMPHAKELKKKFADDPRVVFMYISVDDDKEKWEKFLADDPEFTGVHLITGSGWESDVTDAYMIRGIPRYILVDQNGKIVSSSAPRPSSGEEIEGMINDLLAGEVSG